jgi:hypothetical protein
MDLKSLLSEEIEREHKYLEDQEVGSEEYSASLKRLSNLQDKLINLEKITSEFEVKGKQMELEIKKFEFETEQKTKQAKFEIKKFEFETEQKTKQAKFEIDKFEFETEQKIKQAKFEIDKFKFETETKSKQMEDEKKDRLIRTIIEGVKIGTSVVVPIIGLVWITAAEKEITFTGALKGYASLFVPKKMM